ncbi:alpha/beta hydrolase [Streptomyces sp. NPDC053048]|uniref:alpha/beta hydrolase n=1 Tax=Streptomyces sp. NPDC053048 TaxID=3365694 RepID=UPI0037CCE122
MPVPREVKHELATTSAGKFIDVYLPVTDATSLPTVLLWHGIGPDERDVLEPLARTVAGAGVLVFVPDWRSDAADGGRAHLLASLEYARTHAAALGGDGERMVLAGWSAGASAAMGVALRPQVADGWRPAAVVGIASRYDRPARTTGVPPLNDLAGGGPASPLPVPVTLVHGTADELMDTTFSRELLGALTTHRWPARLEEVRANHAGAIGAVYDPELDRCRPSEDEHVRAAAHLTAHAIAQAAGAPAA